MAVLTEPYPTSEYTLDEAGWRNSLLGTRRTMHVRMAECDFTLNFRLETGVQPEFWVGLKIADSRFWIGFPDWNLVPSLNEFLGGGSLFNLPQELLPAVLEAAFEPLLDLLTQRLQASVSLEAVVPELSEISGLTFLGFTLSLGEGIVSQGAFAGDARSLKTLAGWMRRIEPDRDTPIPSVPVRPRVEIGYTHVSLEDLSRLKIQDILMMETSSWNNDDPTGTIRFADNLAWSVAVQNRTVVLREPQLPCDAGTAASSQVLLPVIFDIGYVEIPCEEVGALEQETTLDLRDGDLVTLSIYGQHVSRGQIVTIGNAVGVRLLRAPREIRLEECAVSPELVSHES